MNSQMRVIVGLGNPGVEYAITRHNVGFMTVDVLVDDVNWSTQKQFKADIAELNYEGGRTLLVKPLTFMNNSGEAVVAILNYYKLESEQLWVIHDDLDLAVGKAQLRMGGNTAGHHGLESIIQHLKTSHFGRVRIGVRGQELRAIHNEQGIAGGDFVMGRFTSEEKSTIEKVITEIGPKLLAEEIKLESLNV